MRGEMSADGISGYAEFSRRLAALLIDAIILVGVVAGLVFLPGAIWVLLGRSSEPVTVSAFVFGSLLFVTYFPLMESSAKRATLGKLLLGIEVTDARGKRIGFRAALIRTLGKGIPLILLVAFAESIGCLTPFSESVGVLILIPLLVAFLWCLTMWFTPRRQAAHDLVAGSVVALKTS
jgi:uncharacterized RDD family membrane protein YckC